MKLIICPNDEKIRILKLQSLNEKIENTKFMTKKEFIDNYYFSYDEKTIYYLMNKYNINIDVAKIYLKNMYVIDCDKDYKSTKLNYLKELKQDLITNKLLTFNKNFKEYLSNFTIEVEGYYDLDLYEEEALNYKFIIPDTELNTKVYKFNTMEEEVNFTCLKIIELLNNGIDINKIYLTNVTNDYYYTIKKLFKYYHIPINITNNDSIYSTKVISDYLKDNTLELENPDKININKKLVNIISKLSFLDSSDPLYKKLLIDKLKSTHLDEVKYSSAVNIKNLDYTFSKDDYVFCLGFNQDILPKMNKDILYITDSIKDEVKMYSTSYLNKREKSLIIYLLSRIENLFLSYKKSSPFSSFYKSSLINDLNLEEIEYNADTYNCSNIYNKLRLAEDLDTFYLFGEESNRLKTLNTHYSIPYNTYDNKFTGIDNDLYLKNISYPLSLSYTSLNSYNECRFKYYIKYVLKLDDFTDTFAAYIGSMYHYILSMYKKPNFDLEFLYNKYLEKRELTLKEKLLLVRIKKDLVKLIDVLKSQDLITGYDEIETEVKMEVNVRDDILVNFIGYIDKIMFYKKIEDTYFSIIDYKSGSIDTHIEPLKYGLHMQLPVYLYLIHYSKVFTSPIFTGIYYQNILFNYPTWSPKLESETKDRYLLKGYSTDNLELLSRFDSTYENSEYIKSMKYTEEKGFGTYSKIMNNDTLFELVKYTKNIIEEKTNDILNSNFKIDPKVYAMENVSCTFCTFKDLCFMKDKDLVYLEKQDDLSFLGGEE